ncbi:hypothetical protein HK105_206662 [Polyrhizophydium stewartii]|uniref:ABC-2 type transporter transmembrane domain-containing protein n=1 Tax=Polyrhizophydium stewartii TaxID=2732419 RepID=A0ABR4N2Q0_9FUNG
MEAVADNAKQALLQQTGAVSFNSLFTVFASDKFGYDISSAFVPPFAASAFAQMISIVASAVVEEREAGHRDYLITMGMHPFAYYASIFVINIVIFFINIGASSLILYLFKIPSFINTNYLNWFLPMLTFSLCCIALSMCLAFMFRTQASAGAWDVARQVGSTIVFQMMAASVAGPQAELAAARSDKDKMLVGFERLRRIFAFIESPAGQSEVAARLGIVSHEVRETSMSEVFMSFAALQKGADK